MTPLSRINALDQDDFVQLLGGVFEHSPWVAKRAFARRPFASLGALHSAMVDVVQHASREEQLALLNAHPELAGKETRTGTLTAASHAEQSSAGLNALAPAELARFTALNGEYRTKFGFPFIIAVRDHDRYGIVVELERRLRADRETERAASLHQVYRITEMRLEGLINTTDRS